MHDPQSYASVVKDGSPRSTSLSIQSYNGSVLAILLMRLLQRDSRDCSSEVTGTCITTNEEVTTKEGSPKSNQKDESILCTFGYEE